MSNIRHRLATAITNGDMNMFDIIIIAHPDFDIDTPDSEDYTLLSLAIEIKSLNFVNRLIMCGANVNKHDKCGLTPLMIGVSEYSSSEGERSALTLRILERLIESGADINIQDNDGQTPLMMAAYRDFHQCVSLLLKNSANLNLQDENGETAVMMALKANSHRCLGLLLSANSDVNIKNRNGDTVMDICSKYVKNHYAQDRYERILQVMEALSEQQKLDSVIESSDPVGETGLSF